MGTTESKDRPVIFTAWSIHAIMREIKNPGSGKTQTRRLAWRDGETPLDVRPSTWQTLEKGDRLWVKEAWRWGPPGFHVFAADSERDENREGPNKSPLYLPRDYSRLTLIVSDAHTERLQDISAADAFAEGTGYADAAGVTHHAGDHPSYAVPAFRKLWDSLHKPPHAWADNPEVVAVTFVPKLCNIDQMVRS